ncbi:MAG: glycosyltransferase [Bacteroidota bacterium]
MSRYCILVPCYNEATRLPQARFEAFAQNDPAFNVCFVNDGSSDNTLGVLKGLCNAHPATFRYIDLQPNRGKADAVRAAMLQLHDEAQYEWLGFLDADLSVSLEQVGLFVDEIEAAPELRLVVGTRLRRLGAKIYRSPLRHYFSRLIATWIDGLILKIGVYDSQCGAKLFRRTDIPHLFERPFLSRWLFDIELFARQIIALGPTEMRRTSLEVPIKAYDDPGDSRISSTYVLKVPYELIRIGRRYRKALRRARKQDAEAGE